MSLQQVVEVTSQAETLYLAVDAQIGLTGGVVVLATNLNPGDVISQPDQAGDVVVVTATIVEVTDVLAANSSRISTLEKALATNNEIVMNLQRTIVELTATHVDSIFSDPIMVDTLAHRFAIASANALLQKVKTSQHRTPELVVIEQEIPGAIRVTLQENGVTLIEEQLKDSGEWASGDQLSETMQSDTIHEAFGNLLITYGAHVGRPYYIVEDVYLENFRKENALRAKAVLDGVVEPVAEEAPVTTH